MLSQFNSYWDQTFSKLMFICGVVYLFEVLRFESLGIVCILGFYTTLKPKGNPGPLFMSIYPETIISKIPKSDYEHQKPKSRLPRLKPEITTKVVTALAIWLSVGRWVWQYRPFSMWTCWVLGVTHGTHCYYRVCTLSYTWKYTPKRTHMALWGHCA